MMTTLNTTTPQWWIDENPPEFNLSEALAWITTIWPQKISPAFSSFHEAIADSKTELPEDFFEKRKICTSHRNPLFTFLRPRNLPLVLLALTSDDTKQKIDDAKMSLFCNFQEWEKCLCELTNRHPGFQEIGRCRDCLGQLFELTEDAQSIAPIQVSQLWHEKYRFVYAQFCENFAAIPLQIRNRVQMLNDIRTTVGEALELALNKTPKIPSLTNRSDETLERKREIDSIVRKLLALKHYHHKGKSGMSVEKALDYLSKNPTYMPLLRRLDLTLASWKKYVADARKRQKAKFAK